VAYHLALAACRKVASIRLREAVREFKGMIAIAIKMSLFFL